MNEINLDLNNIYKLQVNGNTNITCGAPWYGNDSEIIKRINKDINGGTYELNRTNL